MCLYSGWYKAVLVYDSRSHGAITMQTVIAMTDMMESIAVIEKKMSQYSTHKKQNL